MATVSQPLQQLCNIIKAIGKQLYVLLSVIRLLHFVYLKILKFFEKREKSAIFDAILRKIGI